MIAIKKNGQAGELDHSSYTRNTCQHHEEVEWLYHCRSEDLCSDMLVRDPRTLVIVK